MATPDDIAVQVKTAAHDIGFGLVGIAPAARPDTLDFLHQWLNQGMHGEMEYLERRRVAYTHPSSVLPEVRSLILLGLNYFHESPPLPTAGRIARYAAGKTDYHDLIRQRLKELSTVLRAMVPEVRTRGIVDTAPLLERDFARMAGLGWFGKNTLLLNKHHGSFFFLAGLLTNLDLPADAPHSTSHCGTCTLCLNACPTDAFAAPYVLDSRKCVAYLTIELRGKQIPESLRPGIGDWLFGCDICQDVCPWNRKSVTTTEPELQPDPSVSPPDAATFLQISESQFRERFHGTPLFRTGREALARNAAIVLGNKGQIEGIPALVHGLSDGSAIVREAAAWAIGQIPGQKSCQILLHRKKVETDSTVRNQIENSIRHLTFQQ